MGLVRRAALRRSLNQPQRQRPRDEHDERQEHGEGGQLKHADARKMHVDGKGVGEGGRGQDDAEEVGEEGGGHGEAAELGSEEMELVEEAGEDGVGGDGPAGGEIRDVPAVAVVVGEVVADEEGDEHDEEEGAEGAGEGEDDRLLAGPADDTEVGLHGNDEDEKREGEEGHNVKVDPVSPREHEPLELLVAR